MASSPTAFQILDPVTLVMELKQESNSDRMTYHADWAQNKKLYGGIHYEFEAPEGQSHYTINLIRNAVNSAVAFMTEEPPESHILPVEKDSPGVYYIKREAGGLIAQSVQRLSEMDEAGLIVEDSQMDQQKAAAGAIPASQIPRGAISVIGQMDDAQLMGEEAILPQQFKILSSSPNPITNQPFLTDDDVFLFNDVTVAELLQVVTDGVWNRYHWQDKIEDFQLDAVTISHRDVIVEYDDNREDVRLHTVLEKDSWIDPNPIVKDISDTQHYIYAQVSDVEAAVKKFPQFEDEIRANAEDPGAAVGLDGELLSNRYTDIDWKRDMAIIYTCWIRDQEMAITTQTEDGPVTETVTGLREIKIVGNTLISDGPSRYDDIPVVRFKFITIVDSSYSIGLPQMLKDPQILVNRTVSNMGDHMQFLAHPMSWMVEEVAEKFENKQAIHHKSNDPIVVPMSLMDELKHRPVNYESPPSLDPSHIAFLNIMMAIFQDVANQGDVNRGIASSKAESGIAIQQLQAAGNRTLNLAAKYMDRAVARLNELTYKHMVNFMPIEKWAKYTDKYPKNVLEDMIRRAKDAQFNVKVQTSGTKKIKRLEDQQKALLMKQNGAVSTETFLKIMDVDNPEQEAKKIAQEQASIAAAKSQLEKAANDAETENDVRLEIIKGEIEAKLEAIKADNEAKLEQLKASLEIKIEKAKPKPESTPQKASA